MEHGRSAKRGKKKRLSHSRDFFSLQAAATKMSSDDGSISTQAASESGKNCKKATTNFYIYDTKGNGEYGCKSKVPLHFCAVPAMFMESVQRARAVTHGHGGKVYITKKQSKTMNTSPTTAIPPCCSQRMLAR